MHVKLAARFAAAAVAFGIAIVPAFAGGAQAAPSPSPSETPKRLERTYVVHDPKLIAHPEKLLKAITADGKLDIDTEAPTTKAAAQSYVVDSSRFPAGAKPADPYQYITQPQCLANLRQAAKREGWIKNAFSYCQSWAIVKTAVDCPLIGRCQIKGVFAATPFVFGYGKIGAYKAGGFQRWADFWLRLHILRATGVYTTATIKANMNCKGYVDHKRDDTKCHEGDKKGRTALTPAWRADDSAEMHLVSDAAAPNPADAQIAYAVFQPDLDIKPTGGFKEVGQDPDGQEGGLRFDSAYYLAPTSPNDQLGSVFDRADPGFQYRFADAAVKGVAEHIDWARKNPDDTIPKAPNSKHLAGVGPTDPIHRLAPGRSPAGQTRYNQNRNTVRAFCRSSQMPSKPAGTECDEYPFASTYEGAARWRYDGTQYRYWYSVKWVDKNENGEAGLRLGGWYLNDRILDKADDETTARDGFFLAIN